MAMVIIQSGPEMFLLFHRNVIGTLESVGVNVILISQASSEHSITFATVQNQAQQAKEAIEEAHEVIPMHSFIVTNTKGDNEVPSSKNNIIHRNNEYNTNSESGHLTIPNIRNHTSPNTTSFSNTSSPLLNEPAVI